MYWKDKYINWVDCIFNFAAGINFTIDKPFFNSFVREEYSSDDLSQQ